MKYYNLDQEEQKILTDFENDEFVEIEIDTDKYQQYAATTLNKSKNINIRLSEKVLLKLKAKAASVGIPYQTLASSALHQFVLRDNN